MKLSARSESKALPPAVSSKWDRFLNLSVRLESKGRERQPQSVDCIIPIAQPHRLSWAEGRESDSRRLGTGFPTAGNRIPNRLGTAVPAGKSLAVCSTFILKFPYPAGRPFLLAVKEMGQPCSPRGAYTLFQFLAANLEVVLSECFLSF